MSVDRVQVKAPAIYARVSSEDQVSGTSLDDQVDKCLKQAAVYGWEIPPERIFIDDGYSGSNLERPHISRLREAIRAGEIDCVMVYKLDRLSRNIRDTVNLVLEEWSKQHKVVFRSVTEDFNTNSPLGTLIFSILASFAHFERDVIRDRTENGRRRRFQQGRRAVGDPPYGYSRGEIPGTMVVHPERAEVVRRIFKLYLQGHGTMKIAGMLNDGGHRTSENNLWTDHSIRMILLNEVYIGKVKYSKEYLPGHHEAIIDEETFRLATEVRENREFLGGRTVGSPWLLAGLAKCKVCGHNLYTQPATTSLRKRKNGATHQTYNHPYYQCGGRLKKGIKFCKAAYIQQPILENYVVQKIKDRFGAQVSDEKSIQHLLDEMNAHVLELEADLAAIRATIQDRKLAIERWENAFEKGELNSERFMSRVTRLEQELKELANREAVVESQLAEAQGRKVNMNWVRSVSKQVDTWDVLPEPTKKQLVHYLVDRVLVWRETQGRGQHKENNPLEIDIVWNRDELSLPEGDSESAFADLPKSS